MDKKSARNLFIWGSIFFFVVLVILTVDSMKQLDKRTPPITEQIAEGKMAWHKYDCIGCHTILGNGSYFAPDLTKTAENKQEDYLKKWLMDPRAIKPDAAMPNFGITEKEAEDLVALLKWTSKIDTNGWPPPPILAKAADAQAKELTPGQRIYQENRCSSCHSISGIGGTTGPDLSKVADRRDKDWVHKHFKNPQELVPGSAMPSFGHLSEEDLQALTDFIMTLK
ncbi:MAG TPA: cytochrome c [bacterium]